MAERRRVRWDVTARPGNLRLARLGHQVEVFQGIDDEDQPSRWCWECATCGEGWSADGDPTDARRRVTMAALRHVGLSVPVPAPRKAQTELPLLPRHTRGR